MTSLRDLPSVEQILQSQTAAKLIAEFGRPLTLEAIRAAINEIRQCARQDSQTTVPERGSILEQARFLLQFWTSSTLQPVINATGVIIHTNLGRAPLSQTTLEAMDVASRGYANLEFDMESGKRGSRLVHAEAVLKRLTGVEAAVVVNNNAAAVLLTLTALAKGKRVVIARSQLVEIGGGFRIPDVMRQSGAKLVEVGTTNKVHISDYEQALDENPVRLVMRAHRSNFKLVGFTEEPELKDIVESAHKRGVPVVDDLGSGTLLATEKYGLAHEPTVQESLAAGVDIVCISGDKLLGGPQAGICIGRADLLDKIKKHPLARAVRADKVRLAGLNATLVHYLKDEAESQIPVWRMIAMPVKQIKARAESWAEELGQGEVISGESAVGGGSLPGENLPTFLLALEVRKQEKFLALLREQKPPVIARAQDERVVLDPRTVLAEQEGGLLVALQNALKSGK